MNGGIILLSHLRARKKPLVCFTVGGAFDPLRGLWAGHACQVILGSRDSGTYIAGEHPGEVQRVLT